MSKSEEESTQGAQVVFSIAKIVLAGGILGLMLWKMPIVEMVSLFMWIVAGPLLLFAMAGIITQESAWLLLSGAKTIRESVNKALDEERASRKEEKAAA